MRPTSSRPALLAAALLLSAAACAGGGPQVLSTASSPGAPVAATASASTEVPTPVGSPGTPVLSVRSTGYHLAAPIQRAVAVQDGTSVIVAGGLDGSGTTVGGVFRMDPTSGALTAIGSLPHPVHDAAGAMIGGRLFVFGGGSTAGTDAVQAFDPATGKGAVVGHLPVSLSDLAVATIGSTVYLVGGYDGSVPRREIYATRNGTAFVKVATLPVGLRYPAVTQAGNRLIVAGGQDTGGPTTGVFSVDPSSATVQRLGALPAGVAHAAAFTLGSSVYVAGGRDATDTAVTRVSAVDPGTGEISGERPLPRATADAAVTSSPSGVLLVGGWGGTTLDQVLRAGVRIPTVPPADASPSVAPAVADAAKTRPFAGSLLIADRGNDRLLVMDAHKHIVWRYPSPSLPAPTFRFYFPDDAFFVHGGHAILINEEENNLLAEIAYPSGRTLWTYGHAGVAGSAPGYVHQPDDLYPYPGGGVTVADAKNCRILFLDGAGNYDHQIGTNGVCAHAMPSTVGYPNGDTPLPNGHLLISELNGSWVSEVTATGHVVWTHQLPGLVEPSDPQRLADGTYLVASYASPGAVIRFNRAGKVLWYYHPTSGPGMLDHPSLAMPMPNGLVAVNDDYNHRVILIDPATDRIVWRYGTGTAGSGPGQLSFPDGMDLMLPGHVLPLHVDFASHTVQAGRP